MQPLVSVVVPTYYRNDRLRRTLDSVAAQTYPRIEVVVVDGSGEAHARPVVDRADDLDVTYLPRDDDEGPHEARSVGAAAADGDYYQFLDDDDRLRPEKVEKQVAFLDDAPDVGVVYCALELDSGSIRRPDPRVQGDALEPVLRFASYPCIPSTMLIDGGVVDEIHPFRNRHGADDTGMKIELARRTAFDYLDEPLVIRGTAGDKRSASWAIVDGIDRLLERYAELYDEHDPSVRREILSHRHRLAADWYAENRLWSVGGVRGAANSLRYAPEPTVGHVTRLVGSLGGRPGRRLVAGFGRRLRS